MGCADRGLPSRCAAQHCPAEDRALLTHRAGLTQAPRSDAGSVVALHKRPGLAAADPLGLVAGYAERAGTKNVTDARSVLRGRQAIPRTAAELRAVRRPAAEERGRDDPGRGSLVDTSGLRGTVESLSDPSAQGGGSAILLFPGDQRVRLPVEMITAAADGTYRVPFSLVALQHDQPGGPSTGLAWVFPVMQEELSVQKRTLDIARVRVIKTAARSCA